MEIIIGLLFSFIMVAYVFLCYILIFKKSKISLTLRRFHNAIITIYNDHTPNVSEDDIVERLDMDYNRIVQHIGGNTNTSFLDMLEQIVYRYDTYSDRDFEGIFRAKKDLAIRQFVYTIWKHLKNRDPFIGLPSKEATILKNINIAINEGNVSMGAAYIEQMSTEIINKERKIEKQKHDNQIATIISVVGVVLTIVFGIVSLM